MKTVLGILGGGQLARMMITETASIPDVQICCLSEENSPASQVCQHNVVGSFNNYEDLEAFAYGLTHLTIETEHVNTHHLSKLQEAYPLLLIYPSIHTITRIQNKLTQKDILFENGVKVGAYKSIATSEAARESIVAFASIHNYPVVLKSTTLSYDGHGMCIVTSELELDQALSSLVHPIYAEAFVRFDSEVSVIVARDVHGAVACYDPTFTCQRDGICHYTITPYTCSADLRAKILSVAISAVKVVNGIGVFGVEMFIVKRKHHESTDEYNEILVNEVACRPHNSGHWTIDGTSCSQFKQHVRCVTGGSVDQAVVMLYESVVMLNILGDLTLEDNDSKIANCAAIVERFKSGAADNIKGVLCMYGKAWRVGRKLGHLNLFGEKETVASVVKKMF